MMGEKIHIYFKEDLKMSKRFVKVVSLISALAISLSMVACGSSSEKVSGSSVAAAGSSSAEEVKASGGEIEFWSVFTGPDGESMQKMVDGYNKTNPAMKVKHRPILADDLYAKIPTMVASGKNVPDIVINHIERIPLFAEKDMLLPLDDYITKSGKIKADDYVKTAWDNTTINGKHYGIPLDVHSFILYYNEDLLKKYNATGILDDNKVTFDEAVQVSETAKKDGIKGMGVTWMRVLFLSWFADLGGKLSEDGINPTFASEAGIKTLQNYKDLHDKDLTTKDGDDPVQLFKAGKLVFLPEGIWMKSGLDEVKTLKYGMTNQLSFNTTDVNNWTSSHNFVMLKNPSMTDERASAALDFIAWVGENSIEWAKAGQNPACLKIKDNADYGKMMQSFLLNEPETLKIYNYKYFGFAVEALDKVVTDAVFGKVDIKQGLEKAQKETADRIKAGK